MENYTEIKELLSEVKRQMERDRSRMEEELETKMGFLKVIDGCSEYAKNHELLLQQLEEKEAMVESLTEQLQQQKQKIESLKQQLQEKEVRLSELGKLSAGVAKKSSQDDVSKALRIYLNNSKRKTLSKREAAKTVILEFITAAKLEISEDIMELLSHYDDETPEPAIVIQQAADVITDGGIKNIKNIRNASI